MARVFAELQSAQASAERVLSMIETEPEIKDLKEVIKEYGDQFEAKIENWPELKGRINFKDVKFYYNKDETILDHFNLDIKAGETIRNNIAYTKLDATMLEIKKAAKLVNADDFIQKLPDGYDTIIGESGDSLSTGQKQLLSFARAILAVPRIFVLDEATSSIDTEMEQIIQGAIERMLSGRTSIVIANRLSTIRSVDRIICLRNGKIIEEGSHNQLLAKKGYYYNLYTTQFRKDLKA